jgi:hypothetical protein
MMVLADYIRKVAALIKGGYHIEGVKIFFSAPNPNFSMDTAKSVSLKSNFQWVAYQGLLFKEVKNEDPVYYVYSMPLDMGGKEKGPDIVFESDSDWSGDNKKNPTDDMPAQEAKKLFTNADKFDLFPKNVQTTYINTDDTDRGREYSSEKFKTIFQNDFYVVLGADPKDPKGLSNPVTGDVLGKEGEER